MHVVFPWWLHGKDIAAAAVLEGCSFALLHASYAASPSHTFLCRTDEDVPCRKAHGVPERFMNHRMWLINCRPEQYAAFKFSLGVWSPRSRLNARLSEVTLYLHLSKMPASVHSASHHGIGLWIEAGGFFHLKAGSLTGSQVCLQILLPWGSDPF